MRMIANGIDVRPDPNSLVVGPTGLGLAGDTLYVADSVNSRILAVRDALDRQRPTRGRVVSAGGALSDPLGMAIAPNGDIITVNGNDGLAVETNPSGPQVATATFDNNNGGGGNLFGLALAPHGRGVYFVDDFAADNSLFVAPAE
jgi:sugar lactone lactonase YvrE